jgi:hypothetical protein
MRSGGWLAATVVTVVFSSVLSVSTPAFAQSDEDRAGARAAAGEGAKAMDAERWSDAVDLFTRAESLVHAPPHLLYMARAYVKLGKLVRARETYLKVARETLPPSAPPAFADARARAIEESAALEARVPTVRVVIEGAKPGEVVTVTMDGAAVPPALMGVAHPVDPGEHTFEATGSTMASEKMTLAIAEGKAETMTLPLSRPIAAAPIQATPETAPIAEQPSGGSGLRTGAFIAWGIGAVGVVAGTVFVIQNRGKRSDADALCTGSRCPKSSESQIATLDSDADKAATLAWVGYGIGVAGIAAGTVMFLMSSPSKPAPTANAAKIQPWISPTSAGLRGSF